MRIHRAAKNLKRFSRKLETVPAVPRRRTRVLPCSLDRLRRETKENITRVARRPLNGSFLRVWCSWDVARQIAAASPAAMERIARSLTGSLTRPLRIGNFNANSFQHQPPLELSGKLIWLEGQCISPFTCRHLFQYSLFSSAFSPLWQQHNQNAFLPPFN